MFDLLVFIGRFQPFHLGHEKVTQTALELSKAVLLLVGSAQDALDSSNPFTYEQRKYMIRQSELDQERIHIAPIIDHTYNDSMWLKQVNETITSTATKLGAKKIGIIGCDKDSSSYYLSMFPQYECELVEYWSRIDATNVRTMLYNKSVKRHEMVGSVLSSKVNEYVFDLADTEQFKNIAAEYHYENKYDPSIYPVNVLCVDAVVEIPGHVLLVRRKNLPGKGKLALPGGHLETFETVIDGLVRELKEETKLKIPKPVLLGSIKSVRTFDAPKRSKRARVLTFAHHIYLPNEKTKPEVRGGDDAEKAFWMPTSELKASDFFEDHYYIIKSMLNLE